MQTAATHPAAVPEVARESVSTRPPLISEDWLSVLVGAALIPAPVRAGEALDQSAEEPERATPKPA